MEWERVRERDISNSAVPPLTLPRDKRGRGNDFS
jgi:hypothetical protein